MENPFGIDNYSGLADIIEEIMCDDDIAYPDQLVIAILRAPKVSMTFREFMEMCLASDKISYSELMLYGLDRIAPSIIEYLPNHITIYRTKTLFYVLSLLGVNMDE